jgi:NAD(P)-dependent dehydrogenase (short-subunit alcohol dehydrogenase family)
MGSGLEGRVAVITGSGHGIGRAVAMYMAQMGVKVVVNDVGTGTDGSGVPCQTADRVVEEIETAGGIAVANHDTVATMEGGERIIQTAMDSFGQLDILVNNAGNFRWQMIYNMAEDVWDDVMAVHLKGHFTCTRHACAIMKKQKRGRIINTASESGLGAVGQANYSAVKEGIIGFTRAVARDMGSYGVTCNAIRPRAATVQDWGEIQAYVEKAEAMGVTYPGEPLIESRHRAPEDVAPFVAYLASDRAAQINGCDFVVYGGRISLMSQPMEIRTVFKEGRWTLDEINSIVPDTIAAGLANPAPPRGREG